VAERDRRRSHAPHGTRARYNHRTDPCHCPACTEANTLYERERRRDAARQATGERPMVDDAGNVTAWELPLFED
jgi:hypothetical protein